ncbi:MAG: PEP-utilizing enzyme [Butyricicoccaceae bacterium]
MGGKPVAGFITKIGGRTSHSAIMARSDGHSGDCRRRREARTRSQDGDGAADRRRGRRAAVAQPDEQTLAALRGRSRQKA